jgi:hypothetical protein
VIEKAVAEYQKRVEAGQAYVTIGNEQGPVHLAKAAAVAASIGCDEHGVVRMRAKVLDTPMGKVLQDMARDGDELDLGYSAVGVGSTRDGVVQDDFIMTHADIAPVRDDEEESA